MKWFLEVIKKYAVFTGRARRKEYWFFALFCFLFSLAVGFIDGLLGTFDPATGIGTLGIIFALALFVPSIAVTVRRLHDTDRSGWWMLIVLIPLIGGIVLLVFMVLDSTPGQNRFGPNPKTEER